MATIKKILLAGGGSGGHVTPLRSIARSINSQGSFDIRVMTDRGYYKQTAFLFDGEAIKLKKIYSGKYRRYNNKSFLWHITHLPTVLKNIRDVVWLLIGCMQAVNYFIWHRPDVVFCKGGYVCVPIGIAAHLFKVPLIIHDSDTHPGLTNRFLSRWATKIATGMPAKYYNYDPAITIYTGIPVDQDFAPNEQSMLSSYKKKAGFDDSRPVLLITGGGTGAQELNKIVTRVAPILLKQGWQLAQVTGKGKSKPVEIAKNALSDDALKAHWHIYEFTEMLPLVKAADIIISRAGATALQEFSNAMKPVIVVPSPYLTGGHQLKNAALFAEYDAVVVLQEAELQQDQELIANKVHELWAHPKQLEHYAKMLHKHFAKPHASKELADLVVRTIR